MGVGDAVKVFEKNTTFFQYAVFSGCLQKIFKRKAFVMNRKRWRFFSKPVGLDLYSIVRLVEGAL